MSSLYGRKAKPFEYQGNQDDDDDVVFFKKSTTGKVGSEKRKLEIFSLDSDDDEVSTDYKSRKTSEKDTVSISLDDDEDYMAGVNAKVKALAADFSDSENEIMVLDSTTGNKETKHSRKAKALLKKVATTAKGPTPKKMTKAQAAAAAKAAAAALNSPDVIDLDGGSTYVIPQLDNTVQLPVRFVPVNTAMNISLDRMQSLAGTGGGGNGNGTHAASSSAHSTSRAEPEKPQCRLKTRLNGMHERKWRIPCDESFGKLRGRFAAVYGLPLGSIKFQFDGETIKDSETPQSLDMDDDNMVDVTVDKALYANAVSTADRAAAAVAPVLPTGPTSAPKSQNVPAPPSLRLRTRLNGSHEWKWQVALDDTFGKLRQKYSEIYGVPVREITFVFDGDVVRDSDTPKALGMEQDYMIDVKVAPSLYQAAFACANSKY